MDTSQIVAEVTRKMVLGKSPVANPTTMLLTGLEYSGKSYVAERVTAQNYTHFWATKIKKQYGINNDTMLVIAREVVSLLATDGYNVIVDYNNHTRSIRQNFQSIAKELGVRYLVVYLDTPREERLRRREENARQGDLPGRRVISLEDIHILEREFEAPGPDEHPLVLGTTTQVKKFLGDLSA